MSLARKLADPHHKKSTLWLRLRGASSTGKKAKRMIHRTERHESRQELRNIQLETATQ